MEHLADAEPQVEGEPIAVLLKLDRTHIPIRVPKIKRARPHRERIENSVKASEVNNLPEPLQCDPNCKRNCGECNPGDRG